MTDANQEASRALFSLINGGTTASSTAPKPSTSTSIPINMLLPQLASSSSTDPPPQDNTAPFQPSASANPSRVPMASVDAGSSASDAMEANGNGESDEGAGEEEEDDDEANEIRADSVALVDAQMRSVSIKTDSLPRSGPGNKAKGDAITYYGTERGFYSGKLVAANETYIAYAVKAKNDVAVVRVINRRTEKRALLRGHHKAVVDMAFSTPDSDLAATVDQTGLFMVWLISDREGEIAPTNIMRINGTPGPLHRVVWHSKKLVACSHDTHLEVWHLPVALAEGPLSAEAAAGVKGATVFPDVHSGAVRDMCFSVCGQVLFTASVDGTVGVLGAHTGAKLDVVAPLDGAVTSSVALVGSSRDGVEVAPTSVAYGGGFACDMSSSVAIGYNLNSTWVLCDSGDLGTVRHRIALDDDQEDNMSRMYHAATHRACGLIVLAHVRRGSIIVLQCANGMFARTIAVGIAQPCLSFMLLPTAETTASDPTVYMQIFSVHAKVIQELSLRLSPVDVVDSDPARLGITFSALNDGKSFATSTPVPVPASSSTTTTSPSAEASSVAHQDDAIVSATPVVTSLDRAADSMSAAAASTAAATAAASTAAATAAPLPSGTTVATPAPAKPLVVAAPSNPASSAANYSLNRNVAPSRQPRGPDEVGGFPPVSGRVGAEIDARLAASEARLTHNFDQLLQLHAQRERAATEEARMAREAQENQRQQRLLRVISESMHSSISAVLLAQLNQTILPAVRDQLALQPPPKMDVSKATVEPLARAISTALQQTITSAFMGTFQSTLVPAFERATQTMFKQMHTTFDDGSRRYAEQVRSVGTELLSASAADVVKSTLGSLEATLATTVSTAVRQGLAGANKGEIGDSSSSSGGAAAVAEENDAAAAAAAASAEQERQRREQQWAEIEQHVKAHDFGAAFSLALAAQDLDVIVRLCQQLDPAAVFAEDPSPLSQAVIVALIQQLAFDLRTLPDLKIQWLQEAVCSVDSSDDVVQAHGGPIMQDLQAKLAELRAIQGPSAAKARPLKMLCAVVDGFALK